MKILDYIHSLCRLLIIFFNKLVMTDVVPYDDSWFIQYNRFINDGVLSRPKFERENRQPLVLSDNTVLSKRNTRQPTILALWIYQNQNWKFLSCVSFLIRNELCQKWKPFFSSVVFSFSIGKVGTIGRCVGSCTGKRGSLRRVKHFRSEGIYLDACPSQSTHR